MIIDESHNSSDSQNWPKKNGQNIFIALRIHGLHHFIITNSEIFIMNVYGRNIHWQIAHPLGQISLFSNDLLIGQDWLFFLQYLHICQLCVSFWQWLSAVCRRHQNFFSMQLLISLIRSFFLHNLLMAVIKMNKWQICQFCIVGYLRKTLFTMQSI